MTEKEKMRRQMLYDANYDEELLAERTRAKELCYDFNQLRPSDTEGQRAILQRLLGKTGENFCITAPFWCDYGYNIQLGENFYANHGLVILDGGKVTFGHDVFVAPNCGFHTAGAPHRFSAPQPGAGIRLSHHRGEQRVDRRWGAGHAGGDHRGQRGHRRRKCGGEGHPQWLGGGGQPLPGGPGHHRGG